ncbi:MAG: flagellar basal body P-ring protein FlgI [Thermoguttaceae bacterium]|jgi:flagellar P-ring protein precursor FlgI|nr:flagellar basal body P-ring protein FlgI [Thermoguttaceae bacterium]
MVVNPAAGKPRHTVLLAVLVLATHLLAAQADGRTTLKTICRVKGQEENTLQGLGIVMGLKGTGDGASSLPTLRSLAQAMQLMGSPLGKTGLAELKDAKNVALVVVTATVPAAGARQGDRLDCQVSSIGAAKSLAGGRLFTTLLLGPDPHNPRVYATAEGWITLDSPTMPTAGRIRGGCRLEEDFFNPFVRDGKITLVLDRSHADFQVAQDIADMINSGKLRYQSSGQPLARALNQNNIEVAIPQQYLTDNDPVDFVSQVLGLEIPEPQTGARVVINERAGSIVIGDDVEIGAAVVSHKNIVVETGATPPATGRFVPIDPSQVQTAKLKSLVESLNALHVPTEDVIEIIKGLERNGKLHAQLIIE